MQVRRVPLHWLLTVLTLLVFFVMVSSITLGAIEISFSDSLKALLALETDLPEYANIIIHQIRLPRTLLAFAVGAILAMCGAVMQGLFRNPLADPGIIGVSAGASLGAAIAIVMLGGVVQTGFLMFGTVPLFAFIGGAVATFAVYVIGSNQHGTSVAMMLLAGVALGAISGAIMGLLNYFADDQALRDLSLWSMGSLAGATWDGLILAFSTLAILAVLFMRQASALNALLLGEAESRHLGINIQAVKRNSILLTAAGVGVTVVLAGIVGFIGLVVPHIVRMLTGPDHKAVISGSMLLGGLMLLFADMISRTIIAPLELPVGIVTAAIGAPFFLVLLIKQRGRLS